MKKMPLRKDDRGGIAVEATILFPIIIMIFTALVLLSIYLPLRAAMQRSTQFAATAIATERSDTWLDVEPGNLKSHLTLHTLFPQIFSTENAESLTYQWVNDIDDLPGVYSSLIDALSDGKSDDTKTATDLVINMEKMNIIKPSSNLTVEYGVVNYIVYREVIVTARRSIPLPINLTFIGIPNELELAVTSTAVVQNGDEFIRNMDLVVDIMDELFNLNETFSGLTSIANKFTEFLGI